MIHGLVSVVIPVYNTEKYLDRCIESLVNQTWPHLEILLVDDGSTDRCPGICDDWAAKDSRIRVIHKKNAGLGMARNTGIENASGEYICFFDSDDYIASDTVEKAYVLACKHQAQLVLFGMASVNRNGEVTSKLIPETQMACFSDDSVQEDLLPDLLDCWYDTAKNRNLCLSACLCLFSMDLIRETGWRFVSERELISEDSYSLIWLYRYVSRVAILPEALYFYCENGASLTRIYRPDRYERIRHFYLECMKMAQQQGHGHAVCESISGVFLSFAIASMKQTAAAALSAAAKKREVAHILNDETMVLALEAIRDRHYGRARRILFRAMRARQSSLVLLLLAAQNVVKK